MFSSLCQDNLTKGFTLTTLFLLGVGLEQTLVSKTPSEYLTLWFLSGNVIGLPLGAYLWGNVYPFRLLPLCFWIFAGIAVITLATAPVGPVFFVSGLIFGVLILHLFLLGRGSPLRSLIPRIGTGIIAGNIFLFVMERLPRPLGLAWLAILLAGWRINRPNRPVDFAYNGVSIQAGVPLISGTTSELLWFWLFFLCFYTLGGLYYSMLDHAQEVSNYLLFDFSSLALYITGISILIFLPRSLLRFAPYLAVAFMGLSISLQIAPGAKHLYAYPMMDLSFGIMDCLSISVILAFSQNLAQAALGFSLYPVSIIFGLFMSRNSIQSPLLDYQWALAMLFITIIPLSFAVRLLKREALETVPLFLPALPPPNEKALKTVPKNKLLRPPSQEDYVNLAGAAATIGLSEREKEVFFQLVQGKKLKEIAADLGLALGTIKVLCSRIYEKAGVKGKRELVKLFVSQEKSKRI